MHGPLNVKKKKQIYFESAGWKFCMFIRRSVGAECSGHRAVNCAVKYSLINASLFHAERCKCTWRITDAEFVEHVYIFVNYSVCHKASIAIKASDSLEVHIFKHKHWCVVLKYNFII